MTRTLLVVSAVTAATTCVLGIIVLAGWHSLNFTLIQIYHGHAPMHYSAAIGFVAAGLGLLASCLRAGAAVYPLGGLALAIGMLSILERVFDVDLGLGQLAMADEFTGFQIPGNRMAFDASIN